jgi:hypothetical protein
VETAAVLMRESSVPVDDQRAVCECGKQIRWCGLKKRWFHVHNFMTFCTGRAFDENHNDEPKARPVSWIEHGQRIQAIKLKG